MGSAIALRLVVVSLGALVALGALARIRRIERVHAARWGARLAARTIEHGGAYRASRVTVLIAHGVPSAVHAATVLGTVLAVLDLAVLVLAPVALAERFGARPEHLRVALTLLVPVLVAGVLVVRAALRDADRLARCEPEELETLAGHEWVLVRLGVLALVAVLGTWVAKDVLLAVLASLAVVLGVVQLHLLREAARRVRAAADMRSVSLPGSGWLERRG